MVTIMLRSCTSICCCFLCKNDTEIEDDGDKNWKGKNITLSTNTADITNNNNATKLSKKDDTKVICEANIGHILSNQNGSQNSLYRYVSSSESMSISVHESIIEEEEIEDAEVCDSIVYVVDGEPCYAKERNNPSGSEYDGNSIKYIDNDSGSGYSSDVTIVNVIACDVSLLHQNCAQSLKVTNAQTVNKQKSFKRQTKEKDKPNMRDDHSVASSGENLSLSHYSATDSSFTTPQIFDIGKTKLRHLTDEMCSANKSTLHQGKSN